MTGPERVQLSAAVQILLAVDQKLDGIDERVRVIEQYVAGQEARNAERSSRAIDQRARVAVVLTAIGTVGGLLISLLVAIHAF